ncbi:MAG: alanine racemase [Myxococcaceae bacterium]
MRTVRPTRAEIDLDAVRHNLSQVRALAGKLEVMAVVKANAYGHGAARIAQTLEASGVHLFGVALVEEALELRAAGVKADILVLAGAYEGGYHLMVEQRLMPTIFREEHLTSYAAAAKAAGVASTKAHLKLDTGMGRIGVLPAQLPAFVEKLKQTPEVQIEGLLSHFANADLADPSLTLEQVKRFKAALALLRGEGIEPRFRHLANSAAVIKLPEVRDGIELNLVRPGLMLYGVAPTGRREAKVSLKPVMRWRTAITHLKQVPAGTPISYGGTWVTERESMIATLPVGYADGYIRKHSSRSQALVRGKRATIAGRVCMDMCMLDVTDVPEVTVGDEVVLMGAQGHDRITPEELAAWGETINYEVLCGIGARVPRVFSANG